MDVMEYKPMGKLTLVTSLLGLLAFAVASCCNIAVAVSLLVTFAACTVKICKVDTEPVFLLTVHCMTSSLMLLDTPTILSLVVAVVAAIMAFGSCEVATDRVAVFLISLTFSTMFGQITATIASVVMATILIYLKLRPLNYPVVCMLGLHLLGVIVLFDHHLAGITALTLAALVVTSFVAGRLKVRCNGNAMLNEEDDNANNNNDSQHSPAPSHMHNGCLQLSNPTNSLDLQDHTVTSALQALHQFLTTHEEVYKKNRTGHIRHLKVITGEGGFHASQEMVNLIKPTVANFLKLNKYRFDISRDSPGIFIIDMESHAL